MKFFKKNWANLLLILFLVLLIFPQTRKPIQVTLNRMIAFSPSTVNVEEREHLQAYSWHLISLEGQPVNFTESEGKVAIVNLWATWCPPCIAEMPSFQSLYDEYGEKVDFYFISSEERDRLQRFMQKNNYDLPVFQPRSVAPAQMQSNSLPTTYVISKSGEIVVDKSGAANWNDGNFKKLLDELVME